MSGQQVRIYLTDGKRVDGELRKHDVTGIAIYRHNVGLDNGLVFYPMHRIEKVTYQ